MFAELTREDLHAFGLLEFADRILSASLPAVHFFYTPVATVGASSRSRFGGVPLLPPALPWPIIDDAALSFVAQLDCAEIAGITPELSLPKRGHLAFFSVALEALEKFPGVPTRDFCRVIYIPAGVETVARTSPTPANDDYFASTFNLVLSRRITSPCTMDEEAFRAVFGDHDWQHPLGSRARALLGILDDVRSRDDTFGRIGGYPAFLQDSGAAFYGGERLELLLQFRDGGDGHCYFFIPREDLLNGSFESAAFYYDYL